MNIFDLNNPLKPTPIPTKPGRWHKADTAFEDKPIQSMSHVQSAIAMKKFTIFHPGEHLVRFLNIIFSEFRSNE